MKNITYYSTPKRYDQSTSPLPKLGETVEIVMSNSGLCIGMTDTPTEAFRKPRLYICRGKGLLQLNRGVFVEVSISENIAPMLRCQPDVEVITGGTDPTVPNTFSVKAELVLMFPEYLRDILDGKPDAEPEDIALPLKTDDDRTDAPPPELERVPTRPLFEEWLARRNGGILAEYSGDDSGFVLAHDGKILLLVSFFDESAATWLADEDPFDGKPPLWFSECSSAVSPVYTVAQAARHLDQLEYGRVLPVTIVGDHVDVINRLEIAETWEKLGVAVCYCARSESPLSPFGKIIEFAGRAAGGEYRLPEPEMLERLKKAVALYRPENG